MVDEGEEIMEYRGSKALFFKLSDVDTAKTGTVGKLNKVLLFLRASYLL